jgi:hypothetical protein
MNTEQDIKVTLPISIVFGKTKPKKLYLNLNQYRNWHYQTSNKLKILFKEEVRGSLDFSFLHKVEIVYTYFAPDKRKRDLMNVIAVVDKFFQDALTEEGCIETDDTDTVIKITSIYGGVDKNNPRLEAVIKHHQYKH